jgi:hypothetical protein
MHRHTNTWLWSQLGKKQDNSKLTFTPLTFNKYKTFSVLIHSYINTSGNWENEKLCGNTTPEAQNKYNQKGHSFDVRRSRRHRPAYTRERAAAMFLKADFQSSHEAPRSSLRVLADVLWLPDCSKIQ